MSGHEKVGTMKTETQTYGDLLVRDIVHNQRVLRSMGLEARELHSKSAWYAFNNLVSQHLIFLNA